MSPRRGSGDDAIFLEAARAIVSGTGRMGTQSVPVHQAHLVGPNADTDLQVLSARQFLGMAMSGGDAVLLHAAVLLLEAACAATPARHPERDTRLWYLALARMEFCETEPNPAELAKSERLINQISPDSPKRSDALKSLADLYVRQYEALKDPADLDRAVGHLDQLLATLPKRDPDYAGVLVDLGYAHRLQYVRTGAAESMDHVVDYWERALVLITRWDANWADLATKIGIAHLTRYTLTGIMADLDRALELLDRAKTILPKRDPIRAQCFSVLGEVHRLRYERLSLKQDLDRAVEYGERAVRGQEPGADHLNNLAIAYLTRYAATGSRTDGDRAIAFGERSLNGLEGDYKLTALSNLGLAYRRRYRRNGAEADLDRAVDRGAAALALAEEGHPAAAGALTNLAVAHLLRLGQPGRTVDRQVLDRLATLAHGCSSSTPYERARAHYVVGGLALDMGVFDIAIEHLDTAVELLPLVSAREIAPLDQEYLISGQFGVVSEAVAAHCVAGDPAAAVAIAEAGRGLQAGRQLDARTDLTDLEEAHPDLARRFRESGKRLEGPDGGRRRRWAEYDELLKQIRRRRDFQYFLRPAPIEQLRSAAQGGHVVLVNAGERRGHAIIVNAEGEPRTVPLPGLNGEDARNRAADVLACTQGARSGAGRNQARELTEVLDWLWDTAAGPVVDALPETGTAPKVWWLPIGALGLLPLHAAGRPGEPGALSAMVSSYTTSLRMLKFARRPSTAAQRRQLVVALARTPGMIDLPGAAAEAASLLEQLPEALAFKDGQASAERVLKALPASTWAHFACHATADLQSPSKSGLRLHDGALPSAAIGGLWLRDAELAYLSACSTAQGGALNVDEAIHVASAFQLAGFRHVVASLWPLEDQIARRAAKAFYDRVQRSPSPDSAAETLRQVSLDIRAEHPGRPDLWATLIHYGA
ncbi:CHAT domain-containing protein [Glycomyces algeriensis]|uniref:CHAT domain-containing protein n=1 Tax=Glycomyces algeriensis TaxID=256037 RepID=A0A9W6LH79_9ACTN|nr:CHAT domain-containing protein [Glycomyces algeriensis]MDA1364267.1 CHAT domain-containing protein [Glycomyces algeriensis]MDR7350297.1 tetratricopeptide (TPR) repeat protein [Glycomyces algeriensis]GLI43005.1 hypothetical protein GALLR39Z86_28550 [Glycomyces algeriensis]